ncbi:hypothetical protein B9J78_01485 [bacterium Unc6]|nr:hypothetical protein [bacterium Unc6]
MKILIRNGRVIDPKNNIDNTLDILVKDGVIASVKKGITCDDAKVINAKGKIVFPGLIDLHAHLRQPGREDEETIESGLKAAAHGGWTTITCMPNTNPPIDEQEIVRSIIEEAKHKSNIRLCVAGCITQKREGMLLSEIGLLRQAGISALSDDGNCIQNASLARRAMEYARMFDVPIFEHCEDRTLSADGVMSEGYISTKIGLKGIPAESESIMVARDIELLRKTGCRLHLCHISKSISIELIKMAKAKSLSLTCETSPHYIAFTDEDLFDYNTNLKVNPPIGNIKNREQLRKAVIDGTIDAIATDHAPHTQEEKEVEFDNAPFGIIGLETALSVIYTYMVHTKLIDYRRLVELMSLGPAKILCIDAGHLSIGSRADIVVFDPDDVWEVKRSTIFSKSINSPWLGWTLKGKIILTIADGEIEYICPTF